VNVLVPATHPPCPGSVNVNFADVVGAPRIVTGPPAPAPVPLSLAHVLDADGFLLCRYRKTP
jgi:hypothetical protein